MTNVFLKKDLWQHIAKHHSGSPELYTTTDVVISHYSHSINLLTYFKGKLVFKLRIVGIPCSVSKDGFAFKTEKGEYALIQWVKSKKGATLLLNVDSTLKLPFPRAKTLPTFVLENTFGDMNTYLTQLRSHYRYRIKQAKRRFETIVIAEDIPFDKSFYPLYESVYNRSKYPLEKLTPEYFDAPYANICAFYASGKPIGFCQYTLQEDTFYFLFCGIDYSLLKTYDTYYNMLLFLVDKGLRLGAKSLDFGQTTDDIKQKFGAKPIQKDMVLHHSNPVLRLMLALAMPHLGYRPSTEPYQPFHKENENEHLGFLPKDL